MDTIESVKSLITGYLESNNIELVEITYKREQGGMVLRLLVDTPEGITINECEKLNNYLSRALDREGEIGEDKGEEGKSIIGEHFLLEVASPGLDRPLITDRDFTRAIGKELYVSVYEPIDGKREHEGKLYGMDVNNIILEAYGISTVIPRTKIARARLSF